MSQWNSWSAKHSGRFFGEGVKTLSLFFTLLAALTSSCTRSPQAPAGPQSALIARGRTAYVAHCTACHNSNPSRAGVVGPDVRGSSLELLEARIVHGTYPAGYKPKRETSQMAKLPYLKPELEALHSYLNAPE